MVFAEHGVFAVKIEDNTLLVDATGPFNEELVKRYEKSIESCISRLENSKWSQIIILHQLSLFTSEAERRLTKTLQNRKKRGLVASAVVLNNIEGESLVKTQMSRCYKSAGVLYEFARTVDDAKKWLSTR
jgi:hypothetical protein